MVASAPTRSRQQRRRVRTRSSPARPYTARVPPGPRCAGCARWRRPRAPTPTRPEARDGGGRGRTVTIDALQRTDLILVVDDDPDIARFVEVNLRLQGFEVLVAHDGQ